MNRIGRPSIFPGAKSERVQALISKTGKKCFEQRRRRLAELARRKVGDISDAAVVEFLARGEDETRALLEYTGSVRA